MRMYFKYMSMHLRTAMEYRESLLLACIGQMLMLFSYYVSIWFLFESFNSVGGFNFYEILLCSSTVNLGYSLNSMFGRGFDLFPSSVKSGKFDTMLIRPRGLFMQIICSELRLNQLFNIVESAVIFAYAVGQISVEWHPYRIFVLCSMTAGTAVIFFGVFVAGAALSFVTIDGLEVINILTHGGQEMAQYPMGIYRKEFLYFFTLIVPLACVNYYPFLYVIGRSDNALYGLLPLVSVIFTLICTALWKMGLRKYSSTGS